MKGQRLIISILKELVRMRRHEGGKLTSSPPLDSDPTQLSLSTDNLATQLTILATERTPDVVQSNSVIFSKNQGQNQILMLRQYHEEGAVVLQKLSEDGVAQEQCLSRLPQSASMRSSYVTLLSSFSDSDSMRMILNKAPQETYSCDDSPDVQLPALLVRKTNSIPTWTEKQSSRRLQDFNTSKRRKLGP